MTTSVSLKCITSKWLIISTDGWESFLLSPSGGATARTVAAFAVDSHTWWSSVCIRNMCNQCLLAGLMNLASKLRVLVTQLSNWSSVCLRKYTSEPSIRVVKFCFVIKSQCLLKILWRSGGNHIIPVQLWSERITLCVHLCHDV